MTGAEIKDLVIVKLEEHSAFLTEDNTSGPLLSGGDSLQEVKPVYSYIDAQLPEAANEVLLAVPIHKLIPKVDNPNVTANEDGTGVITLADDFLRLHTLKMKEWIRPVHLAITPQHPLYAQQFVKYTRGNQHKPVVVYHGESSTSRELSYYSVSTDHTVDSMLYVAKFSETENYNDSVAELIALNCAKKVLEVFGNTEQVSIMTSEIQNVQNNMLL